MVLRGDTAMYLHADRRSIAMWDLNAGAPGPVIGGWDLVAPLLRFDFSPDDRLAAPAGP